jgi:hypothetical protein
MFKNNVATPQQLSMLSKVVHGHCGSHHVAGDDGRERVAFLALLLFNGGLSTPEALKSALLRSALSWLQPRVSRDDEPWRSVTSIAR